jgi:hypothetical protein
MAANTGDGWLRRQDEENERIFRDMSERNREIMERNVEEVARLHKEMRDRRERDRKAEVRRGEEARKRGKGRKAWRTKRGYRR